MISKLCTKVPNKLIKVILILMVCTLKENIFFLKEKLISNSLIQLLLGILYFRHLGICRLF